MAREFKLNECVYFHVIDRLHRGVVAGFLDGLICVQFHVRSSPHPIERNVRPGVLFSTPEAWRDAVVEALRATVRKHGRTRTQLRRDVLRVDDRLIAYWAYVTYEDDLREEAYVDSVRGYAHDAHSGT